MDVEPFLDKGSLQVYLDNIEIFIASSLCSKVLNKSAECP